MHIFFLSNGISYTESELCVYCIYSKKVLKIQNGRHRNLGLTKSEPQNESSTKFQYLHYGFHTQGTPQTHAYI